MLKNNQLEVFILDCHDLWNLEYLYSPERESNILLNRLVKKHIGALKEFIIRHLKNCAVSELILTVRHPKWREVYELYKHTPLISDLKETVRLMDSLRFCVFSCPLCERQLKVEVEVGG